MSKRLTIACIILICSNALFVALWISARNARLSGDLPIDFALVSRWVSERYPARELIVTADNHYVSLRNGGIESSGKWSANGKTLRISTGQEESARPITSAIEYSVSIGGDELRLSTDWVDRAMIDSTYRKTTGG